MAEGTAPPLRTVVWCPAWTLTVDLDSLGDEATSVALLASVAVTATEVSSEVAWVSTEATVLLEAVTERSSVAWTAEEAAVVTSETEVPVTSEEDGAELEVAPLVTSVAEEDEAVTEESVEREDVVALSTESGEPATVLTAAAELSID